MLLENDHVKGTRVREFVFLSSICLFYLFHAFTASPLFVGYGYDREVFRYFGMLIYNGGTPYVDAFDHKPPVIYFLYFFGHFFHAGPWGAFIIFQAIGVSAALALFATCKKHLSTNHSIVVTIFYIALIKYNFVLSEGGLTRELTSALTILLFSVCLNSCHYIRFFIGGVLFGIIFYTQQNEIIAIIPIMIYFLISDLNFRTPDLKSGVLKLQHENFYKLFIKRTMFLIAGCLLIHVAIFLVFYRWDALDQFISQAFLFNSKHYISESSFVVRFIKIVYHMTVGSEIYFPIFLAVILSCYPMAELLRGREKVNPVYYFLFASLLFQFFAMSLGRLQPHYFLSVIPYLVLIIFYFLKFYPEIINGLMNRERIAIGSLAIVIMLTAVKGYYYGHPRKRSRAYKHEEQIYEELYKKRGVKGQLYSFDASCLALNSDLDIIAPSRWVYQHFFMSPGFDDGNKLFEEVLLDIERAKCTYIIVPLTGRLPEANKKELKVYLDEKYTHYLRSANNGLHLYKRKN